MIRPFLACLLISAFLPAVRGDEPTALRIIPPTLALSGPLAHRQVLVLGRYADGSERDLTPTARFETVPPGIVEVGPGGFVQPEANGQATVRIHAAGQHAELPVEAVGQDQPPTVSFRRDFVAALNVAGCNAGACHGTPSGKNGFKLSLRGFDPEGDHQRLTRDIGGRRTNAQQPEQSLVLLKGTGSVPHEGGARLLPDTVPTRVFRAWLTNGLRNDPADLSPLRRVEVVAGPRVVPAPIAATQLAIIAHFADGSEADVTRLTVFSSSDEHVAKVDATGRVEFHGRGEAAILCRYLEEMVAVRFTRPVPVPGLEWTTVAPTGFIDRALDARLKELQVPPSPNCADADFLRRATLDICGVLPTAAEARAFLADTATDKRARLIDALLDRPEFADYWALKWADVLNNNRRAVQAKGAYLLHRWLRDQIVANTPWDEVARSILTASGSTFDNPPANFYRNDRKHRPAEDLGQAVAQVFMGVRITCAKCHNHPFERWTQDDYHGLAAFFARVESAGDALNPKINRFNQGALSIVLNQSGEVVHPRTNRPAPPRFPGGGEPPIPADTDRRVVLAQWLTRADNPFFSRSVANRVWYHLLGRGIVDQVDDFRDSNPPASGELLDALARDFAEHHFDVKHLIRTIAASNAYQRSAVPLPLNREDERFFSHATSRLHSAEVLLDALSAATEVPEPFEGMPLGTRAVQLPDPDVFQHPFLTAFGTPARETVCECERLGDASLGHALQLVNGETLKAKLRSPRNRLHRLLAETSTDAERLDDLYLGTLSRLPAERERQAALDHLGRSADATSAWEDIHWALLNSKEFLFRH